ncbi:hypothetical protein [Dyadobacter psychrotolerans]|uniref:Uncharacterized protein n=1 Tax=Dyadobacter psychrotolerans TaxID=2541721 RepID=A0A4R5DVN4_9BACT|nr:hypothetical protein [Dyadobacter psychrotolerans]TDE18519.1 hypothetical protein E0F88_02990 [Dyadobacter psychrotolerans]
MKTLTIVFGLLLAWMGCDNQNDILKAEVQEVDAVWSNQLASDGCAWHFTVISADSTFSLAASDGSLKTIEKALGKLEGAYSFTDVHLKYSLTGAKKEVQCGWGKKVNYDEIEVHEIVKK